MADESPESTFAVVAALIAKAQSSPYPDEQQALALRSYRRLAAYLNAVEPESPASERRWERRLLKDRRRNVIDLRVPEATQTAAYRREPTPAGQWVDVEL